MAISDLQKQIFQRPKLPCVDALQYDHDQSILGIRKDEQRRPNATLNPEAEFEDENGKCGVGSLPSSPKRRDESVVQPLPRSSNAINCQDLDFGHQYLNDEIRGATRECKKYESIHMN